MNAYKKIKKFQILVDFMRIVMYLIETFLSQWYIPMHFIVHIDGIRMYAVHSALLINSFQELASIHVTLSWLDNIIKMPSHLNIT